MNIKSTILTAENFKSFGILICPEAVTPMGENNEITYWGELGSFNMGPKISSGIMKVHKRKMVLSQLERHIKTPEILVALDGKSLLCVAPPEFSKTNTDSGINTFLIKSGDVIVLHKGCWHWAGYPIGCDSAMFLVIFTKNTEQDDQEIINLSQEYTISL